MSEDYRSIGEELQFNPFRQEYENRLMQWCKENNTTYITPKGQGREELDKAFDAFLTARREEELAQAEAEAIRRKAEEKIIAQENAIRTMTEAFVRIVPPRYKDARISDFRKSSITTALMSNASGLILGDNGPGKTRYIWALVREFANIGDSFVVVKAQVLLEEIKRQDDHYGFIDRKYRRTVRHLIIDEIDKIFESRADFVYMNYLIDIRYEYLLQTICVGNGTKERFIESLGQSVFSRLAGEGGIFLAFKGEDRRFKNNEESNEKVSDK